MYDPFASPPPPGTMQATAQQPQVMPNPAPVAPNNALAAIYNKHMRNMLPGLPNGMFPPNPGQGNPGWQQDFQQARTDWRGAQPDHPTFDGPPPADWRAQMDAFKTERRDWRDQRPERRDYRMGTTPTPPAV